MSKRLYKVVLIIYAIPLSASILTILLLCTNSSIIRDICFFLFVFILFISNAIYEQYIEEKESEQ